MKLSALSVAAGAGIPLILTGAAGAGFTGINVVGQPNPFGLLVCDVYVNFNRPGQDFMYAVAGPPAYPLNIQVIGGTFYQHPFGGLTAPQQSLVNVMPSLAFDSFVTIGVKTWGTNPPGSPPIPQDHVVLTAGFASDWHPSQLCCSSLGWAVTPADPQGNPFDPANSFPGNGQILVGRFSTANGTAISGIVWLQFRSNGVIQSAYVSFLHVPEPGAMALLGMSGLLGTRRRRERPRGPPPSARRRGCTRRRS